MVDGDPQQQRERDLVAVCQLVAPGFIDPRAGEGEDLSPDRLVVMLMLEDAEALKFSFEEPQAPKERPKRNKKKMDRAKRKDLDPDDPRAFAKGLDELCVCLHKFLDAEQRRLCGGNRQARRLAVRIKRRRYNRNAHQDYLYAKKLGFVAQFIGLPRLSGSMRSKSSGATKHRLTGQLLRWQRVVCAHERRGGRVVSFYEWYTSSRCPGCNNVFPSSAARTRTCSVDAYAGDSKFDKAACEACPLKGFVLDRDSLGACNNAHIACGLFAHALNRLGRYFKGLTYKPLPPRWFTADGDSGAAAGGAAAGGAAASGQT